MKKQLYALAVILIASPHASAQDSGNPLGFWLEAQAIPGDSPDRFSLWYEHGIHGAFGLYAQVEFESGYREVFAGPTWNPARWLTLGAGIGREYATGEPSAMRRNAYIEVDSGQLYAFGTLENGGTGKWYQAYATYAAAKRIRIGAMSETDLGAGPRIEFAYGHFQMWGAWLTDCGTTSPTFGVTYSF